MIEMYLAGISVRKVKDITNALWDSHVNGNYAYVYLDGIYLKRSWAGSVKNIEVLVAIGVNEEGYREVLGVSEGFKENYDSWLAFIRWLMR